jgi:3-methyladenine DNA glycosylase AlkD
MNAKTIEIIENLKANANRKNVEGMARFGINSNGTLGISMVYLRNFAKVIKKDHETALELWDSGIHEAKILAVLIAEPKKFSESTAEKWVSEFDSWDVCDQACMNLIGRVSFARKKAIEWSFRDEEFVKRAGFVIMAVMAVHEKKADDNFFDEFFERIISEINDDRNFVKKAVNWALRQIGKRNMELNHKAVRICQEITDNKNSSKAALWTAKNAYKELTDDKIIARIKK